MSDSKPWNRGNVRPTTVADMLEKVADLVDATEALAKALERETGRPAPLSDSQQVQDDLRALASGLSANPALDAQVYALLDPSSAKATGPVTDGGYKNVAWRILLAYGGAIKSGDKYDYLTRAGGDIDYYGAHLAVSSELSEAVLTELRSGATVDIDASSDPAEHVGYGFNGTFTSTELSIPYLAGTLCLTSGTEIRWGLNLENTSMSGDRFATILNALTSTVPTWDEALDLLERRIALGRSRHDFLYRCTMPSDRPERI